jgi:CheY-like chemotaxis protein
VGSLAKTLDGLKILLIEDDQDTREVLTLGLTLYGAEVAPVSSASEALVALERERPDVILSDIGLPDEDGLQLIRRVRRLPPSHGGRVPAVAVTAYTLCDDVEETARAGFQRHFRKPVETAALFSTLAELGRAGGVERRRDGRRTREEPTPAVERRQVERRELSG